MSTQLEEENWNQLTSFPFKLCTQPLAINNNEFMVAPSKNNVTHGDGIYKFNVNKNEWIKIFDYDSNLKCTLFSSAYDNENKLLYACDTLLANSKMLMFDLNSNNKITSVKEPFKKFFKFFFIENKLHQICNFAKSGGPIQTGDHYIYNSEKQFDKITTFKPLEYLVNYGLIYLKLKKSVMLFGGHNLWSGYQNSIFVFSNIDSTWKELNIKIPKQLAGFGIVSTRNEQYVIILGGYDGNNYSDNIFIYNTRNNTFIKSKIKCPKRREYYAIVVNNSTRDETATYGFVNACFKNENFINMQLLPEYLIKIICCYYYYEQIYLLGRFAGEHWKINIDYILQ